MKSKKTWKKMRTGLREGMLSVFSVKNNVEMLKILFIWVTKNAVCVFSVKNNVEMLKILFIWVTKHAVCVLREKQCWNAENLVYMSNKECCLCFREKQCWNAENLVYMSNKECGRDPASYDLDIPDYHWAISRNMTRQHTDHSWTIWKRVVIW
jgi:hypothetical protein